MSGLDRLGSTLLVATTNGNKVKEVLAILALPGVLLRALADMPEVEPPDETGETFLDNARQKAVYYAERYRCPCLAEDSGLEVDALGGIPGVYSARFLGPDVSYPERMRVLAERLQGVPHERRTARFRSAIVLRWPDGAEISAEGTVEGFLAEGPRGNGGFGYDPIFWVAEHQRTFGELGADVKNGMSHRARALAGLRARLLPN